MSSSPDTITVLSVWGVWLVVALVPAFTAFAVGVAVGRHDRDAERFSAELHSQLPDPEPRQP